MKFSIGITKLRAVIIVAIVAVAAVSGYFYLSSAGKQPENALLLYSIFAYKYNNGLVAAFNKDYPSIKVTVVQSPSDYLANRALTEFTADNVQADVIMADPSALGVLKSAAGLEQYNSPQAAKYLPPFTGDGQGYIQPSLRVAPYVFLYNSKLVSPSDAPKSLADILNTKWKEKIAMVDPTLHTATLTWFASLNGTVFKTSAEYDTFVRGLVAQKPSLSDSLQISSSVVASGQSLIGAGYLSYVVSMAPAPLNFIPYQPLLAIAYSPALLAKAPHPNNGKLFIDWILSDKAAQVTQSQGEIPGLPGFLPNISGIQDIMRNVVVMKPLSSNQTTVLKAYFKTIFA